MDTIEKLTDIYGAWLRANELPEMSADELGCDLSIKRHELEDQARELHDEIERLSARIDWLRDFETRWDAAQTYDDAFAVWRASRVWCADFDAAGLPHAVEHIDGGDSTAGYAYCDGAYIVECFREGKYWTIAGQGDIVGTLDECERYLWANHSRHEV